MSLATKITRLAKNRVRPAEIAEQLNVSRSAVYSVIRDARRRGVVIPLFSHHSLKPGVVGNNDSAVASGYPCLPVTTRQLVVPVRIYSLLEREAERHGLTTSEAAGKLLESALLGSIDNYD